MSNSSDKSEMAMGSLPGLAGAFPRADGFEFPAEGPSMRAVAMMSSGPSLVESRGPVFGKPPPLGISRPPVGLKRLVKPSFGVKQEWRAVTSPSAWTVKGEDLEMVPDFPLERTHREITDADAAEVAKRISDILAALSIEAEYDCQKAKAKCKTSDYVGFRIRLYAGTESGQPVVVEVQRRCGSASSFMRSCRAILNAAEGKKPGEVVPKFVPPFVKQPIRQMKCLKMVVEQRSGEGDAKAALEGAVAMLRSKKSDANVLGLEKLYCLTDPLKTAPDVALLVSKYVALGEETYDVREEIRVLTERDVFTSEFEEQGLLRHAEHLRHLALGIFANALELCSKDGCLSSAFDEQKWFEDYLIPYLIDELKRATTSSCNAHQAACCVHGLMSCSARARQVFMTQGGLEPLQVAYEFGRSRHALLAEEAGRCLKIFDVMSATA